MDQHWGTPHMMEKVSCRQYVPPMRNTKSRFPSPPVHSILVGGLTPLQRRYIDSLEAYYSSLSVKLLFKHNPRLQKYLGASPNDPLVTIVRPPLYVWWSPYYNHPAPRSRQLQQTSVQFTQPTSNRTSCSTFSHQAHKASVSASQAASPKKSGDYSIFPLPGS